MSEFSILQLSDTHLSSRFDYYFNNNKITAIAAMGEGCDHIVHTGDVTLDGIRFARDFEDCVAFREAVGQPARYLPGNHDIGDNPKFSQPADVNGSAIDADRLRRYEDAFGDSWWSFDQGAWRIIGINAMIIGSGLPQEQLQYDWISGLVRSAGEKHLALFSHLPVFIDTPEDGRTLNHWSIDPAGHTHMHALIHHPNLRLVASGHLHQQRSRRFAQIALEWCPSTAFTAGPALVPEMGGNRQVGYLRHRFHENGEVGTTVVVPEGLANAYLDDVVSEVYPNL